MTIAEAAKYLDIEYDYCRKLIMSGRLKATRRGRVWDVDEESVKARVVGLKRDLPSSGEPDVKTVIR